MGNHARRLRWTAAIITGLALLFGCTPTAPVTPSPAATSSSPSPAPTHTPTTLRVLAIGNSYSAAAVEWYLSPIARRAGDQIVIGSAVIGGSAISQHVENLASDAPKYRFVRIEPSGERTRETDVTLSTALHREKWDIITLQQASQFSGDFSTFSQLGDLAKAVLAEVPSARIMLHQTWAYAEGSTMPGFSRYGNDQKTMDDAITNAYRQAQSLVPGSGIIPTGAVIRHARTVFPESAITQEDGSHLGLPVGQYLAAATWYAVLFDNSVEGNTFPPPEITDKDLLAAQRVVDEALGRSSLNPGATPTGSPQSPQAALGLGGLSLPDGTTSSELLSGQQELGPQAVVGSESRFCSSLNPKATQWSRTALVGDGDPATVVVSVGRMGR